MEELPKMRFGLVALVLTIVLGFAGCDLLPFSDEENSGLPPGTWESLNFNDKFPLYLTLEKQKLYVGAGTDGVWQLKLNEANREWRYLGLADTSLPQITNGGIMSLDLRGEGILAGDATPSPNENGKQIGLWRSLNDGETWVPADSGFMTPDDWSYSGTNDISRSPHAPNVLMAGYGALFRSSNGAHTWKFVGASDRNITTPFLRFTWHPTNPEIVWAYGKTSRFQPWLARSKDAGRTWERYYQLRIRRDNAFYRLAFDATNSNTLYLGGQGAVYKSTNGGQDWINDTFMEPLFTAPTIRDEFRGLVTHPKRSGLFFAAAERTVYVSTDGGDNVYTIASPNERDIYSMIYDVQENMLYIGALDGVYRLKDPLKASREMYGQ
jgi:hypothetical protein